MNRIDLKQFAVTKFACPALSLLLLLAAAAPALMGQAYTPPPPPLTTAPCVPTKKQPCDAPAATAKPAPPSGFAFPGESDDTPSLPLPGQANDSSAPIQPAPARPTQPLAPGSDSGAAKPPASGTSSFPFPGDDPAYKDTPSSSSSSSSNSAGASSSDPDSDKPSLNDEGSSGTTKTQRRQPKVENLSDREAKDLEVAHYYLTTGNYVASFNRAKDAVRLFPDDPEAHFVLAVAAQNMKNPEQATAEYQTYLKLAPDGDHAKEVERALKSAH